MDRVHESVLDAKVLMYDLCYGSETVCRAGCIGDDVMVRRIVDVLIHTEDDRNVLTFCGGGDDDLLHAAPEMLTRILGFRKTAGRLDHNVSTDLIPGDGRRVFLGEDT